MRGLVMTMALLAAPAMAAAPAQHAAPARNAAPARPAASSWLTTVVTTPEGGYRMGNPNAPVKLVEYGARTCPTCARFDAEGFPQLKAKYIATGKVSYEFRDYPVHGAIDLAPILLGRCVSPARYFALLDAMMLNQKALIGRDTRIPQADQERLQKATPNEVAQYLGKFYGYLDFAVKRGLPLARANACLADRKAIEGIAQRADAAGQAGVSGTPAFFINGTAAGVYDWASIEPKLMAAGAQ